MIDDRIELIEEFTKKCGIKSVDRDLLDIALTHRSYVYETDATLMDNERMEFLGDAVIGNVVAEYLFKNFEQASEGELSKLRARLVSRAILAKRSKGLEIGPLLRLGKGEEQTGGRERSSLLGSALEAVIGAIYLSLGMQKTRKFVLKHIIEPSVGILATDDYFDYKSRLQEIVQQTLKIIPEYRVIQETGPEHDKIFTLEVWINEKKYASGTGSRKKTAENIAAKEAFQQFKNEIDDQKA